MPNKVKLWESFDDVLAHRERWDQRRYITGRYVPGRHFAECGTTQCIAGFRCLRDGLIPIVDEFDSATGVFAGRDGSIVFAPFYAAHEFELNWFEQHALFRYYATDPDDLKRRIEEIIDGRWAQPTVRLVNP